MRVKIFIFIVLLSNILLPCAVCYGDPESLMSHGMNMGVLTLMGFIGFILCGIMYAIISISIRTKNINKVEG